MKRAVLLFIALAFALVLFVIFLPSSDSSGVRVSIPRMLFVLGILCVSGLLLYLNHENDNSVHNKASKLILRKNGWGNIVFASMGLAIAVSLIMLIIAFLMIDYDVVVQYLRDNFLKHLFIVQLFCVPIVIKFLK